MLMVVAAAWLTVADRPAKKDPVKEERRRLEGTWTLVAVESRGRQLPEQVLQRTQYKLVIRGNQFLREIRGRQTTLTFTIDPKQNPRAIDLHMGANNGNRCYRGIYLLEGDTLKIRQGRLGGDRPTSFDSGRDQAGVSTMTFKRAR
jgi:uncharacterized protein (TIGR03067 family)